MTLSGATTPGKNGPGSEGIEGVLHIPQNFSITGTSPSYCLESYPGYSSEVGLLPLSRGVVGVFYNPSRLGNWQVGFYGISTLVGYLVPTLFIYLYIKMICKQIVRRYRFKTSQSSFICWQLNCFQYCYLTLIILFDIIY